MLSIQLFGGFALEGDGGALSGRAAQKKRLAVLVLVGSAPTCGLSREKLIGLLWPESGSDRARHQLSSSVYELRRVLGEETILAVGDELRLNSERVTVDVRAFRQALAAGDWSRAVDLYTGPFLDGFFISDAPEFERWAGAEREAYARDFAHALERLAESLEQAGDARGAIGAWRRLATHDVYSSRVALRLMQALVAVGDTADALQHARIHATLLREDCGVEPGPEIAALVERLLAEPLLPTPAPAGQATASGDAATAAVPARPISPAASEPPQPVRAPQASGAVRGLRRLSRRWSAFAAGVALLCVAGALTWTEVLRSDPPQPDDAPASIAVLPFVDMTPAGDAEYFGDGLAEELIHALSQLEELRVVARTSAFAFKGQNADVRRIGEALDVGSVLEGSVRRSGERLKITVQLIDTRSGYQRWSGSYEAEIADVVGVQEEISRAVVGALRPALLRDGAAPRVARASASPEAYQLYMQGRFFWNQRTEESLRRAIDRFEAAIRLDPGYAAAYTGLSDAHNTLADNGFVPSEPALTLAEAAVRTALELDDQLAEAYSSRGHLRLHRWDWTGAERDFRRALELNPGYAVAHQYYAFMLTFQGRFDEAIAQIRIAQQLDPLSVAIQNNVGEILSFAGRHAEAVAQLRAVLQMDSTWQYTRWVLGSTLSQMGAHDEAIAELRRVIEENGGWHRAAVALLGVAYQRAGRTADAEAVRRDLERGRADGRAVSPYQHAMLLAALGRRDEAIARLEEALATVPSLLGPIAISPEMDPLRSDPRYTALLRRVGLSAATR